MERRNLLLLYLFVDKRSFHFSFHFFSFFISFYFLYNGISIFIILNWIRVRIGNYKLSTSIILMIQILKKFKVCVFIIVDTVVSLCWFCVLLWLRVNYIAYDISSFPIRKRDLSRVIEVKNSLLSMKNRNQQLILNIIYIMEVIYMFEGNLCVFKVSL